MDAMFQTPEQLLAAYYSKHATPDPACDALWLLKVFVEGGFQWRGDEVREYVKTVLDRACFDVSDLAENFLGLDLYVSDLSNLDSKAGAAVFGLARPRAGAIEICRRAEAYEPLFRSTVMHEVAHIVKHGVQPPF